jgi:hypothetical protein
MTRTTSVALLGLVLAQGCIIYEDRKAHPDLCEGTWSCGTDSGTWTDTGEVRNTDLQLTIAEGRPGEDLLSTLVNVGPETRDLSGVANVEFSRDVAVLDLIARADEVVLLLHVADDADPGAVDVSVSANGPKTWLLAQPFMVLEAPPGGTTCTPGTGGGTTSTEDTACP